MATLGLQGQVQVRDLWSHTPLKPVSGTFEPQVNFAGEVTELPI